MLCDLIDRDMLGGLKVDLAEEHEGVFLNFGLFALGAVDDVHSKAFKEAVYLVWVTLQETSQDGDGLEMFLPVIGVLEM